MQQGQPTLEDVMKLVEQLSPEDKRRLVERVSPEVGPDSMVEPHIPRKTAKGLLADLGTAPSAEEIDEARREAWKNFPREDV
ncbi:MAG: hypothetical protein EA415_07550 [Sphaerobacteraceae bacterium]|nr:MAG: hypothetical protein EA415_07550 [Sphaerobacteraceae bacterium]